MTVMKTVASLFFLLGLVPLTTLAAMCTPSMPVNEVNLQQSLQVSQPTQRGVLENPALIETSGLAASKRHTDVFWAINDSGNDAMIFALDDSGNNIGQWALNARTYDWEDLTSVQFNGEPYLLVADIGDNRRERYVYRVYVFSEPDSAESIALNPAISPVATIRFEYPDGSHNAEALTSDGEYIYIMTKASVLRPEHGTSGLYRIPMTLSPGEEFVMAEYLGTMPKISQGAGNWLNGVNLLYPTAMEISPDNRFAHILTYDHVLRVERNAAQTWGQVLLTGGKPIYRHTLIQGEALTASGSGTVWLTTEGAPAPLWALPAP